MRKLSVVAVCMMWFVFSSVANAVEVGDTFPKISVKHHKSGNLDNSDFKNKVTIINFWATWCETCKVELKEMQAEFKDFFKNKSVKIVFISLDKKPAKAVAWFKKNLSKSKTMLKHLYIDPTFKIADMLELDTFPMTYVLDKKTKVVLVQKGFKESVPSTAKIVKKAKSLLK